MAELPLDQLAATADFVAIVKVERIVRTGGFRLARARVSRTLTGAAAGSEVAFAAQSLWTCDTSHAEDGETASLTPLLYRADQA